jgi:hypothetical protein
MQYKFIPQKLNYDGTQLRSLFGYIDHGVLGDSIVAFEGACDISFEHMVDGEDFLAGSAIHGGSMLHFIIEEFGASLELAVTRQRLFASIAFEALSKLLRESKNSEVLSDILESEFFRLGDDIYLGDRKLSISIATRSPVSSLIHFAMNITNENTPVKTVSLSDFDLKPRLVSDIIAQRFLDEIRTIKEACCKVRWVK